MSAYERKANNRAKQVLNAGRKIDKSLGKGIEQDRLDIRIRPDRKYSRVFLVPGWFLCRGREVSNPARVEGSQ